MRYYYTTTKMSSEYCICTTQPHCHSSITPVLSAWAWKGQTYRTAFHKQTLFRALKVVSLLPLISVLSAVIGPTPVQRGVVMHLKNWLTETSAVERLQTNTHLQKMATICFFCVCLSWKKESFSQGRNLEPWILPVIICEEWSWTFLRQIFLTDNSLLAHVGRDELRDRERKTVRDDLDRREHRVFSPCDFRT